jgi:hypothetical protein
MDAQTQAAVASETDEGRERGVKRVTDKTELVETHNLAISLQRLQDGSHNGYDQARWKRALYHALGITVSDYEMRERIRQALKLP